LNRATSDNFLPVDSSSSIFFILYFFQLLFDSRKNPSPIIHNNAFIRPKININNNFILFFVHSRTACSVITLIKSVNLYSFLSLSLSLYRSIALSVFLAGLILEVCVLSLLWLCPLHFNVVAFQRSLKKKKKKKK
jgi:hypothetical protein